MKIVFGCDPNASDFKTELIQYVGSLGHEVVDFGSDDPIYANVAFRVGEAVANKTFDRGILICGTGIGVSIAANKVPGVCAALVTDVYQAERAQLSNNANVITLGAQVTGIELGKCLVRTYLEKQYDPNSRSTQKIKRISDYENERKSCE